MKKQLLLATSCCVLFLSCFAANVSYCQQIISNTDYQQIFLKTLFSYFPNSNAFDISGSMKNTFAGNPVPYVLQQDSMIAETDKTNDANNSMLTNNDSLSLNDTVSLFTTDADSFDNKEAGANSITVAELKAGKEIKTSNGTVYIPAEIADKKIDRLITKYAEMISLEPEDVKNYPLYKFINDWYGVKYKWGGTDNYGIDCSAFSQKLYNKIYGTNIKRTARQQHKNSEKIKDYEEANEGDLVFFRIHHIRISHVGVYLANGYFVHASRSHGVVISSLEDKYWSSRYAGCGRIAKQDRPAAESDFLQ